MANDCIFVNALEFVGFDKGKRPIESLSVTLKVLISLRVGLIKQVLSGRC
jgi:hypothetical protein